MADSVANVNAMLTGARGGYKKTVYDDEGRWLADYIMDSMDEDTAQVVKMTTVDGTAYSTNGIDGPYETAIMANGTILGKFIEAHSVTAEKISQDYTKSWEDADTKTLNTARTEFKAADAEISARVNQVEIDANSVKTDLAAEIKVRADQIAQTVKRGQINSTIKQTAETIYIESNKFGWKATNSSMTTNGTLTTRNMIAENITATGTLQSENSDSRMVSTGGKLQFYSKINNAWRQGVSLYASSNNNTSGISMQTNSRKSHFLLSDVAANIQVNAVGSSYSTGITLRAQDNAIIFGSSSIIVKRNQDGKYYQAFSGDIYLTYGNGGKIYLIVKNGLICGWHL